MNHSVLYKKIMEDLDENSELFNRTRNRIIALHFALKLDPSATFDQIVLTARAFENYLNEPIPDGQ